MLEPAPATVEVTLPVGLADAAGERQRLARLRKLTGHEEALLYSPGLGPGELVTELIRRCVVQLGPLEGPVDAARVEDLSVADRDFLMLALRRWSLGDRLSVSYACPACGAEVRGEEDLSTLEVRDAEALEPVIEVALEDGYVDREGQTHAALRLRAPRGRDLNRALRLAADDPLRARDALTLSCVVSFGGLDEKRLSALGLRILRGLSLGDRRRIFDALDAGLPGVDFRRSVRCGACGARFTASLDATDFFGLG